MKTPDTLDILLQDFPAAHPSLRLAVVTETWPPEVNGVALTVQQLVQRFAERWLPAPRRVDQQDRIGAGFHRAFVQP